MCDRGVGSTRLQRGKCMHVRASPSVLDQGCSCRKRVVPAHGQRRVWAQVTLSGIATGVVHVRACTYFPASSSSRWRWCSSRPYWRTYSRPDGNQRPMAPAPPIKSWPDMHCAVLGQLTSGVVEEAARDCHDRDVGADKVADRSHQLALARLQRRRREQNLRSARGWANCVRWHVRA